MNKMDQAPLTPEQRKQVKKAKLILWLGIAVVILSGLLAAFLLLF